MSEIHPHHTAAILGRQNLPSVDAVVLGGMAARNQRLANELGLSVEEIDRLRQTYKIFTFSASMVKPNGEIAASNKKQAFLLHKKSGEWSHIGHGVSRQWSYIAYGRDQRPNSNFRIG
jgi:hypothetical protein